MRTKKLIVRWSLVTGGLIALFWAIFGAGLLAGLAIGLLAGLAVGLVAGLSALIRASQKLWTNISNWLLVKE